MDGEFLGYKAMTSELSLCPVSYEHVLTMMKFGTVTENSCEFELS